VARDRYVIASEYSGSRVRGQNTCALQIDMPRCPLARRRRRDLQAIPWRINS